MNTNTTGRQVANTDWGLARTSTASNDACVHYEPGQAYYLAWTTKDPAVVAIHSLFEREFRECHPISGYVFFGVDQDYGSDNWRNVWAIFSEAMSEGLSNVQFVRFEFPTRSIFLTSLLPHSHTEGIGYRIERPIFRAHPYDVLAVRNAFLATADDTLKRELDWVTADFNS